MAGVQCKTSAFWDELHQIVKVTQRFDKHCNCHLQDEYVLVGNFWKPKRIDVNPTHHLLPALYKASKNAQPIHIHPEDGDCNVSRNVA
jgi:hypothetical protein